MSWNCQCCGKRIARNVAKKECRKAIISLRLLYGGGEEGGNVDDCAVLCAGCAGDAWEALVEWIKNYRREGVELKIGDSDG